MPPVLSLILPCETAYAGHLRGKKNKEHKIKKKIKLIPSADQIKYRLVVMKRLREDT